MQPNVARLSAAALVSAEGSVKALVLQALSTRKPSRKDLETIEELLDKLEGDAT